MPLPDPSPAHSPDDPPAPTAKAAAVLRAARPAFASHGYAKTTMQDIASAAGISRASLYLLFANKEELFRAGSVEAHRAVLADVDRALSGSAPALERIRDALLAYASELLADFAKSPHRDELFRAGKTLTGDLVHRVTAGMLERIEATLLAAERGGEISLAAGPPAARVARIALAAVDGTKQLGEQADLRQGIDDLIALLRAATTLPTPARDRVGR
ncbi:TetR/AcrR family transcriptional regulator [Leucobacter sp. M11]|uniref:TetR/AcrR family transcriptional regulator n=1 Tax=Leucobacter sp. M11 TaxID=2993565 RepID=UPI002D7EE959|nr:helix-turn-helix domain-containing protein [Leucobacter sp. M11]MEB4613625.1 helix-turn-helix domain containing protein [Leucobacter sp. M11]